MFGFDIKDLDWRQYWDNYCRGAKQYVLREDLSRTAKCHRRYIRYFD